MDRKRDIADRVIARWRERGFALDTDPHYMRLVELWIAGTIGGAEMRQRYAQFLAESAIAPNLQQSQIGLDPDGPCRSDAGLRQVGADLPAGAEPLLETD